MVCGVALARVGTTQGFGSWRYSFRSRLTRALSGQPYPALEFRFNLMRLSSRRRRPGQCRPRWLASMPDARGRIEMKPELDQFFADLSNRHGRLLQLVQPTDDT